MATSMQCASNMKKNMKVLLRCLNGALCQSTCQQETTRRLHRLSCVNVAAVQQTLLQQNKSVLTPPCRTMCSHLEKAHQLYKTLYPRDHPLYKVIKHKRKKYEPTHPLPLVKDPADKESSVLLYDDEETLRILGQAYLADKPTDDVYVLKHYPPQIDTFHEAMDKLRAQGEWDLNPGPDQDRDVTVTFVLDEKLQKEKKVAAFLGFILYPHRFTTENRVLCVAQEEDVDKANEAGAYLVITSKDINKLVSGEIKVTKQDGVYIETKQESDAAVEEADDESDVEVEYVDYIVAASNVAQYLNPLKKVVRAKYPSSKKGSINRDVLAALELHKNGTSYECKYVTDGDESRLLCVTRIGKMSFTNEQLEENLQVLIDDVVKRKPLKYGPFITEVSVTSPYLDTHIVTSEQYLPVEEAEEELDLTKELELLEKEMEQQRMKQN